MADEAQKDEVTKKSLNLKAIIMVAVMLIAEAGIIIGLLMVVGKPTDVSALEPGLGEAAPAEGDKIVEMLVLDAKLFNNKSGMSYMYDTEIYAHVKQKFETRVNGELEQFQNEIKAEIAAIWKTCEPHQFQEPKNESLTRKVYALLNARFGVDQETGDPLVTKCIVYMGTGLRVDG